MNQVTIFGRLTADPEGRYSQAGKAVVNFSLAVNRYGSDDADFFNCTAFDKQAELIVNSCKKGHRLLVWGRLQQEKWTDQQSGQQRTTIKIIANGFNFIEPKPENQQQAPPAQQPPARPPMQQGYPQQGYPQGGYPPQQPGYIPPAQGGYPPQQGQPPAYPGYPPQGQQQNPPAQQQQPNQQYPNQQQFGFNGNINDVPF